MIDVNWDLVPKGTTHAVVKFRDNDERELKVIEIGRTTKTKTVADAVEYHKENGKICGYSFSQNKMLSFCKSNGTYCFVSEKSSAGSVETDDWQPICTRAEFEAYVKEQEGEKWTHVYTDDTGTDIRCVLLAEHDEWAWVKDAGTVDTIHKSWLKPIKPTLTKSQAWDMLKDLPANEWGVHSHVMELEDKYEII